MSEKKFSIKDFFWFNDFVGLIFERQGSFVEIFTGEIVGYISEKDFTLKDINWEEVFGIAQKFGEENEKSREDAEGFLARAILYKFVYLMDNRIIDKYSTEVNNDNGRSWSWFLENLKSRLKDVSLLQRIPNILQEAPPKEKIPLEKAPWYEDFMSLINRSSKYVEEILSRIPVKDLLLINQRDLFEKVAEYYQEGKNFTQAMIVKDILFIIAGECELDEELLEEFAPKLYRHSGSSSEELAEPLKRKQVEAKKRKSFFQKHFPQHS